MEIRPYTGVAETQLSRLRTTPNRKPREIEKKPYIHNVKPISEICRLGDRRGYQDNCTLTTKEEQIAKAYNPSFEEIFERHIVDIKI